MAEARCPASCGELLQGWLLGSEKLICCPIDWYSTVSVEDGPPDPFERPMMREALRRVLARCGLPDESHRGLRIQFDSSIPVAKGMASSTADIAATAMATARHLGQNLDEPDLARLCVAMEPTDSTIFRDLTLFDHNRGDIIAQHPWSPDLSLLILESPTQLITADYHRRDRQAALLSGAAILAQAWRLFEAAMLRQDLHCLGQATTLSALASQSLLPKPGFAALLDLLVSEDLLGINVAHSGTVVGLLLAPNQDEERLLSRIRQGELGRLYPQQHRVKLTQGGVR